VRVLIVLTIVFNAGLVDISENLLVKKRLLHKGGIVSEVRVVWKVRRIRLETTAVSPGS